MLRQINRSEGLISLLGLIFTVLTFFLSNHKWIAGAVFACSVAAVFAVHFWEKNRLKSFSDIQHIAKILFIDDKDRQIVTTLRRNNFDVRKIDDVTSVTTDPDVLWANMIFVDYKDVGKKLFGKKEGLGLASELRRVFGNKKRYVIYSSVQDFDGMVDFPYVRGNPSYDEIISLVSSEISKL